MRVILVSPQLPYPVGTGLWATFVLENTFIRQTGVHSSTSSLMIRVCQPLLEVYVLYRYVTFLTISVLEAQW